MKSLLFKLQLVLPPTLRNRLVTLLLAPTFMLGITATKNPYYWRKDRPYLDRIVYREIPDHEARYAALVSGHADVMVTDRSAHIKKLSANPDFKQYIVLLRGAGILALNTTRPPFNDVRVRRALAHAWDQKKYLRASYGDVAPPAEHWFGNALDCGDVGYRQPDLDKARALIAEYGKPVSFEYVHTATNRGREAGNFEYFQDFMQLDLPSATVIRCMNVLIYFDSPTRAKMLSWAAELLNDEGIVIVGTNGYGIQTRYAIYRKKDNGLFPGEFAFGLDNLGHIVFMPWFTIHANDPEAVLLAVVAGTIRRDRHFWPSFSGRLDELLQAQGICFRGPDGFLQPLVEELPPLDYLQKNAAIWQQMEADGYSNQAVETLERAGYNAWKNGVGDIAIEPPSGSLPAD